MHLELSCAKKEKSKLAQVWRRLPQKGRVVPVKQNEERVGRVWFCVEGRRPGHSGLPQQEKKARPSTVHGFFAIIGKLSPREPKQPGLQEDGSPGTQDVWPTCDRAQERCCRHNKVQEDSNTKASESQWLAAPGLVRWGRTPGSQTKGIWFFFCRLSSVDTSRNSQEPRGSMVGCIDPPGMLVQGLQRNRKGSTERHRERLMRDWLMGLWRPRSPTVCCLQAGGLGGLGCDSS